MALEKADLALILRAAQRAGIDPGRLRDENPWLCNGPTALALQAAITALDPLAAERLQSAAGVRMSVGCKAAIEGLTPWTPELEAELRRVAPASYQRLLTPAFISPQRPSAPAGRASAGRAAK